MTCEEFSNAFDVLLASYKHKAVFGDQSSLADLVLDEYEKSVFLTQAQDRIIKSYFDKTTNSEGIGFDDSPKRQMEFGSLISTTTLSSSTGNAFDDRGKILKWTDTDSYPLLFLNEKVVLNDNRSKVVVPLSYSEYNRQMSKSYSEPNKNQAWRLFSGTNLNSSSPTLELILHSNDKNSFKEYKARYVRRPKPIVLVDLSGTSNGLTVNNVATKSECELNPILHEEILQEAVRLALIHNNIETPETKAAREANR
jgi:hypothetical protein